MQRTGDAESKQIYYSTLWGQRFRIWYLKHYGWVKGNMKKRWSLGFSVFLTAIQANLNICDSH